MTVYTVSITVGANTSPLSGMEGTNLSSLQVKARLDSEEQSSNAEIKVKASSNLNEFDIYATSEALLIELIEVMRRERYELTVSNFKYIFVRSGSQQGDLLEPFERVIIDAPYDCLDALVQEISDRNGVMTESSELEQYQHMVFEVPSRFLSGFNKAFDLITEGLGDLNISFLKHDALANNNLVLSKSKGYFISGYTCEAQPQAFLNFEGRGVFYIEPFDRVYAGMIIGENLTSEDLILDTRKGMGARNMRASNSEYQLTPQKVMDLQGMIHSITHNECIEVTPLKLRMRRKLLDPNTSASSTIDNYTDKLYKVAEECGLA